MKIFAFSSKKSFFEHNFSYKYLHTSFKIHPKYQFQVNHYSTSFRYHLFDVSRISVCSYCQTSLLLAAKRVQIGESNYTALYLLSWLIKVGIRAFTLTFHHKITSIDLHNESDFYFGFLVLA